MRTSILKLSRVLNERNVCRQQEGTHLAERRPGQRISQGKEVNKRPLVNPLLLDDKDLFEDSGEARRLRQWSCLRRRKWARTAIRTLRSWTIFAAGPANSNAPRPPSADHPFSRLQTRMEEK